MLWFHPSSVTLVPADCINIVIEFDSLDEVHLALSNLILAFLFAGFYVPLQCNKLFVSGYGFQHMLCLVRTQQLNCQFPMLEMKCFLAPMVLDHGLGLI